jgi:hypothetical protein
MMLALLFSCAGEDASTIQCGDRVLVGSDCQDVSTETGDDGPHDVGDGFPTSGDTGTDAAENQLVNPGFEEGVLTTPWDPTATPPGWTATGSPEWLRTGAGLDPGEAHGGDAVAALEKGDGLDQSVEHLLTFDDRYVVRAWARADTPTDAEVVLSFLGAGGAVLAELVAPITAWSDWGVHSLGMQGPVDSQRVSASIRGAGGAAWFDDVNLEVASSDPLTFDLAASTQSFEGFGAQVAPLDTEFVPETLEALGIRFVRVDGTGAKDEALVETEAATGKLPWLLTSSDAVGDVDAFAQSWVSRVQALDALGIPPEAIELLDDPSAVAPKTYAALVDATRAGLDAAKLQAVTIAGPGTRTLVEQHEARDYLLALGKGAPVGAWSFQTGDDAPLCGGGGDACLAIGWDDVLGTFDAMGGTAGHPLWATHVDTTQTTFLDTTWPSPESSVDFNVTASAAYAVRVIENALVSMEAGAQRVYFGYAVDGTSIGSGMTTAAGAKKPLYKALELALPLANGATALASPDQTGRAIYAAVFTTKEQIVVVATNEDDGQQTLDIVLEGVTGKETMASARSFVRYLPGDPAKQEGDVVGVYDISADVTKGDGNATIHADLLPVSVTVLTFDRGA